jgi:hypothetical protein
MPNSRCAGVRGVRCPSAPRARRRRLHRRAHTAHTHTRAGGNSIRQLHQQFKRRIRTRTALPSTEMAAMLFWALLASGQITMRKVDGWRSLDQPSAKSAIDLAA